MYGQAAEGHANNTDNKQLITYNLRFNKIDKTQLHTA